MSQRTKAGNFTRRGLVAELARRGPTGRQPLGMEFHTCQQLSFKESVAAGERDRPDVARRRLQWTKLSSLDQDRYTAAAGIGTSRAQKDRYRQKKSRQLVRAVLTHELDNSVQGDPKDGHGRIDDQSDHLNRPMHVLLHYFDRLNKELSWLANG
jgi:hypothetical protein